MSILQGTLHLAQVRATAAEDKDQSEQLETTTRTNLMSVMSQKEARHQRGHSERPHYINHQPAKGGAAVSREFPAGREDGQGLEGLWSNSHALLLNLVLVESVFSL